MRACGAWGRPASRARPLHADVVADTAMDRIPPPTLFWPVPSEDRSGFSLKELVPVERVVRIWTRLD